MLVLREMLALSKGYPSQRMPTAQQVARKQLQFQHTDFYRALKTTFFWGGVKKVKGYLHDFCTASEMSS